MRSNVSSRLVLVHCIAVLALLAMGSYFFYGAPETEAKAGKDAPNLGGTTFPGTGTGDIPDNNPTGITVSFDVTGMTGSVTDVNVDMTLTHSWVGDLNAVLSSPDGTMFELFHRTGSTSGTGTGDSSDLNGTYIFDDGAVGDWWAEAALRSGTQALTPGSYRTSAPQTGAATEMNAAFSSIPAINGTWTLKITDNAGGDTGPITAANLTITSGAAPAGPADADFNGDGASDVGIIRDVTPAPVNGTSPMLAAKSFRERMQIQRDMSGKGRTGSEELGGGAGSNMLWAISNSNSSDVTLADWGEPATDFVVPADYDGDGKSDIAVWRGVSTGQPSGNAFFYIFESGSSTVTTVDFGQNGDDATVVGDYDGDGKADPAVYRCPASDGQCFFYYKGSTGGGEITFIPWGNGTPMSVFASPGDYDGDGKFDFNVQIEDPNNAGQGMFVLLRSSDAGVEFIPWGLNTDLIAPGDYDGDGKWDIAVGRSEGGLRNWYVLTRTGSFIGVQWGLNTDFMVPGDYDGDGITDFAVFRPDANPDNNVWYGLLSASGADSFEWGLQDDYPITNWRVH